MHCTHSPSAQYENDSESLSPKSIETQIVHMLETLMNENNIETNFTYSDNNNNISISFINIEDTIPFSISIWSSNQSTSLNTQYPTFPLSYYIYTLPLYFQQHKSLTFPLLTSLHNKFIPLIQNFKLSHLLQTSLKYTTIDVIHYLYCNEIRTNNIYALLLEQSPSYFIKNLYTYLPLYDKIDMLFLIKPYIQQLSCNLISTYAIQYIIEQTKLDNEKIIIMNSIKDCFKDFFTNTYGAYVLVKVIGSCNHLEMITEIIEYAVNNLSMLSFNNNGICVVRKIYQEYNCKGSSVFYEKLKQFALDNVLMLFEHVYGNYIIQTIVSFWSKDDLEEIVLKVEKHFKELSNKKYSSNVIEKCLEKSECILKKYIEEVSKDEKIGDVIKNNYGNYVIQKALNIAKGEDKEKLIESAKRNVDKLVDKKLILKWRNILDMHTNSLLSNNNNNNNVNTNNNYVCYNSISNMIFLSK